MGAKRYIKNMILKCIDHEGSYARDLVVPVSKLYGRPISIQRIMSTLAVMDNNEVRKVPEFEGFKLKRYMWFKVSTWGV